MRKERVVSWAVLALLVSVFAGYGFAAEIEADSRITRVMIYPGQALLTRQAQLSLDPGEYKVVFPNIIPNVDDNSLRVTEEGKADVRILGCQLKKEFLKETPSEKIKQLQDEIQKLEDEQRALVDLKSVFQEEKSFLDSLRFFSHQQLPKELVTQMPAAKDLEDTLKFLDIKLKENFSFVMDCEIKLRDLSLRGDALKRELVQISGPLQKLKRSIVVDLQVLKQGEVILNASYLVGGASWQPIYDARANFQGSEVELVSFGILRQSSGEDWQDVDIALSTARPAIGGNLPYVSPWILRPLQVHFERRSKMMDAVAPSMQSRAFESDEELAENSGGVAGSDKKKAEAAYAVAEEKGVAIVYTLPRKASIKSDGSDHKLAVSTQMLKADFEYSTYPRINPAAYLGSRVTNAKDLQLLPGRVNIFLDGDFVGISNLGNTAPQEEFDLYLGVDENVKVKREQVEKKVDETIIGGIPSPTRKTAFKYKLTVESYKSKKIKVKLFDAMPVSEDDRIKVKLGQVSLEPKEKNWQDRKGVWLWELELEPKAKKEIILNYIVEHPRDMQVDGL
ncbi:MAG: mucoidy inhibitor MuiA family protein [Candidatus Omnitrophota bacterium]